MKRFAIGVISLALATSAIGVGTAAATPPPTSTTVILNSQGSRETRLQHFIELMRRRLETAVVDDDDTIVRIGGSSE